MVLLSLSGVLGCILRIYSIPCVLIHLLLLCVSLVRMHYRSTSRDGILTELRLCSYVASVCSLSNVLAWIALATRAKVLMASCHGVFLV